MEIENNQFLELPRNLLLFVLFLNESAAQRQSLQPQLLRWWWEKNFSQGDRGFVVNKRLVDMAFKALPRLQIFPAAATTISLGPYTRRYSEGFLPIEKKFAKSLLLDRMFWISNYSLIPPLRDLQLRCRLVKKNLIQISCLSSNKVAPITHWLTFNLLLFTPVHSHHAGPRQDSKDYTELWSCASYALDNTARFQCHFDWEIFFSTSREWGKAGKHLILYICWRL